MKAHEENICKIKELEQKLVEQEGEITERFGLKTPAGYIGVVGSRKKTKFVTDKLLAEGFTEEQLARVTAPIGIEIGSETPAEIAISIAAQLIEVRSNKR